MHANGCRVRSIPNATSRLKTPLKKGFPNAVRKARRAAARRGRRLRIMFADEARFGRMNRPRPCWAPIGIRPEAACQLIREYVYLYGAVSPKDGTCVYLVMFCSYFPYNAKLCINGNEYLKRQLAKRGVAFEALDNGVKSCADPKLMQRVCDELFSLTQVLDQPVTGASSSRR
jgi:hypothetical protein